METEKETRYCYCAQELTKADVEVEVKLYGRWVKDWDRVDGENICSAVFEQEDEQDIEDAYREDNMTPLEIIEEFHKLLEDERIAEVLGPKKTQRLLVQTGGWSETCLSIEEE